MASTAAPGVLQATMTGFFRISEGMTEWRCGEHVGYGLAEYLDQIA